MDAQEKYQYWFKHAQYDLVTADSMCKTGRWLYVMFMCQQAVEKLVKGIYGLYLDFDAIPRTHNIRRLANDFADKLPYYIDDLLFEINEKEATRILEQTKEVFAWMQTMKP